MKFFTKLKKKVSPRKKVGLVLSSGAARGLAHIGVIRALTEKKIPVDFIAGASIGAFVGACFAKHGDIKELEEVVLDIDWRRMLKLADFSLALISKGFIHGRKAAELLKAIIGDIKFSDLKIPLAVVTTDINSGEEIIIRDGSVVEAVKASISMPAIFVPARMRGRFLIDGGIVDPVPIDAARNMGAEFIIASNALPHPVSFSSARQPFEGAVKSVKPDFIKEAPHQKKAVFDAVKSELDALIRENRDSRQYLKKSIAALKSKIRAALETISKDAPGIFDAFAQSFYILQYEIARPKLDKADILITPETAHISSLEFYRGREAIMAGYEAVQEFSFEKHMYFLEREGR